MTQGQIKLSCDSSGADQPETWLDPNQPSLWRPYMSTDGLIQPDRIWEELQRRVKDYSQMQEQKACCINPTRPEALTPAKAAPSDLRKGSIHFHSQ